MKGKMRIIILAAVALVSFTVAYLVSPKLGSAGGAATGADARGKQPKDGEAIPGLELATSAQPVTIAMKEQELTLLIKELRLKIESYRTREQDLVKRRKRLSLAENVLKTQIDELAKLQSELTPALQRYNEAKNKLEATRTVIAAEEAKNIKDLAKRYDEMAKEAGTEAAKILIDLWASQQNQDLAVQIFYYMKPKSAAKVLEAITASTDKNAAGIASELSAKFKTIRKPPQKKG